MMVRKPTIYRRAKARYPHLEFYWSGDQLEVAGGIQDYTDINTLRREVNAFRADTYFHVRSNQPRTDFTQPTQHPAPPTVQSSGSSWPLPGAAATNVLPKPPVVESAPKKLTSNSIVTMPPKRQRRRKGKPTERSRRYRIQNPALRPRRLPFKQVFDVTFSSGYFDQTFSINKLVPEMLTVYEEMRLLSMTVVFLTQDISVTTGIYTAILLDQNGYGTALKSTETWFKRVSDMPGSLVRHATRGCRLTWKATEPDSRNYVKVTDKDDISKPVARLYMIGRESSLSIKGILLVRGHILCRGQYYDAAKLTVNMMKNLRLQELAEEEDSRSPTPSSSFDAV